MKPWSKYFMLSAFGLICLTIPYIFAQVEEQSAGEAKSGTQGGYNFFNTKTKEKTGFSKKKRSDIVYYDKRGNIIGTLKKDRRRKDAYNFYSPEGIRMGALRKRVNGAYSYLDTHDGATFEVLPLSRGEVSSLSPETFIGKKSK